MLKVISVLFVAVLTIPTLAQPQFVADAPVQKRLVKKPNRRPSSIKVPHLISYKKLMYLTPLNRQRYLTRLADALAKFESRSHESLLGARYAEIDKIHEEFVSDNVSPANLQFWGLIAMLFPEAQASGSCGPDYPVAFDGICGRYMTGNGCGANESAQGSGSRYFCFNKSTYAQFQSGGTKKQLKPVEPISNSGDANQLNRAAWQRHVDQSDAAKEAHARDAHNRDLRQVQREKDASDQVKENIARNDRAKDHAARIARQKSLDESDAIKENMARNDHAQDRNARMAAQRDVDSSDAVKENIARNDHSQDRQARELAQKELDSSDNAKERMANNERISDQKSRYAAKELDESDAVKEKIANKAHEDDQVNRALARNSQDDSDAVKEKMADISHQKDLAEVQVAQRDQAARDDYAETKVQTDLEARKAAEAGSSTVVATTDCNGADKFSSKCMALGRDFNDRDPVEKVQKENAQRNEAEARAAEEKERVAQAPKPESPEAKDGSADSRLSKKSDSSTAEPAASSSATPSSASGSGAKRQPKISDNQVKEALANCNPRDKKRIKEGRDLYTQQEGALDSCLVGGKKSAYRDHAHPELGCEKRNESCTGKAALDDDGKTPLKKPTGCLESIYCDQNGDPICRTTTQGTASSCRERALKLGKGKLTPCKGLTRDKFKELDETFTNVCEKDGAKKLFCFECSQLHQDIELANIEAESTLPASVDAAPAQPPPSESPGANH